jgi:C-terminal processing protease CtpA/Prc
MNKKLVLSMIIILVLALAACGDEEPTPTAPPATEAEVEEAATEAAEEEPTAETAEEPAEEPATEEAAEEPAQDSGLPPAEMMNDEGGPQSLTGIGDYTDFSIPQLMTDPAPTLLDMVYVVRNDPTQFAPAENQILGHMTSTVDPSPLSYAFDLPQAPEGTFLDVDNDGEEDQGVQIFYLAMGANINGDSYLQQLDQLADLKSYLQDPLSGNITEGSVLVFAADDQQGFPSGFGDDGILFTEDDPAVALPQGYTIVQFGPDGFTFDRSLDGQIDVLESPEGASSDFSGQGILESFNSLIDELSVRYSFTDYRNLDWEAIRANYLPVVEELDQMSQQDPATALGYYVGVLHEIAQSVRDAHVAASFEDASSPAIPAYSQAIVGGTSANLGANTTELDDGRIIVTDVLPGSPAEEAGWTFGTEILSVDGVVVEERLPDILYSETVGTDEGQRLQQVANLLKFPTGTEEVTVEAILSGSTEPQSFTMTPAQLTLPDRLAPINRRGSMHIQYEMAPNYGYINWDNFHEPDVRIAVWVDFLERVKADPALDGIIIDMRGNGGGWDNLYFTMASYFFNEEEPVSMHWIDQDVYDAESGELVRQAPVEYLLSAPDPELYYDGPILLLVDNKCASSCEFFSQFLQSNGRATVLGQYGTKGAGAPINRVKLPGSAFFQYTKGRAYFAGTDEFNLEAKGVIPDVLVPTTEETEMAKLEGGDPVLDAAVQMLSDLKAQAFAETITLVDVPQDLTPGYSAVAPDGWEVAPSSTGVNFTPPGSQTPLLGYQIRDEEGLNELFNQVGITDPQPFQLTTREANGMEWTIYGTSLGGDTLLLSVTPVGDMYYMVNLGISADLVDSGITYILFPALDAYTLTGN